MRKIEMLSNETFNNVFRTQRPLKMVVTKRKIEEPKTQRIAKMKITRINK